MLKWKRVQFFDSQCIVLTVTTTLTIMQWNLVEVGLDKQQQYCIL